MIRRTLAALLVLIVSAGGAGMAHADGLGITRAEAVAFFARQDLTLAPAGTVDDMERWMSEDGVMVLAELLGPEDDLAAIGYSTFFLDRDRPLSSVDRRRLDKAMVALRDTMAFVVPGWDHAGPWVGLALQESLAGQTSTITVDGRTVSLVWDRLFGAIRLRITPGG
ncbi:hypothetical protein [Roseospira goensis]|uniref:Nuclear transport factor 2 family protein n=1 Tax=Roseospira goensis TaxID=391922 RepID=A0A7W6S399_9PROT|nr:hypothetical protein [Roseospira goensis]MBB4287966.1 hypothetical protein [Roseospira goensis]